MRPKSPKELFLLNDAAASEHRKLCLKPEVQAAMMTAFTELAWRLPPAESPQASWAANARRQGAQDFMEIFLSLGDPPREMKRQETGQLEPEDAHHAKRTSNTKLDSNNA